MTDVLDGCVRLANVGLHHRALDLDISSSQMVLGNRKDFDSVPCFAQGILLSPKSRVGALTSCAEGPDFWRSSRLPPRAREARFHTLFVPGRRRPAPRGQR